MEKWVKSVNKKFDESEKKNYLKRKIQVNNYVIRGLII